MNSTALTPNFRYFEENIIIGSWYPDYFLNTLYTCTLKDFIFTFIQMHVL